MICSQYPAHEILESAHRLSVRKTYLRPVLDEICTETSFSCAMRLIAGSVHFISHLNEVGLNFLHSTLPIHHTKAMAEENITEICETITTPAARQLLLTTPTPAAPDKYILA